MSKDSQNEILLILSNVIRDKILSSIKKSKYYSILDCTPDVSKTEQITIIISFVSCENGVVTITENVLGFLNIIHSTGCGLCETIIELEKWNIPIEDM